MINSYELLSSVQVLDRSTCKRLCQWEKVLVSNCTRYRSRVIHEAIVIGIGSGIIIIIVPAPWIGEVPSIVHPCRLRDVCRRAVIKVVPVNLIVLWGSARKGYSKGVLEEAIERLARNGFLVMVTPFGYFNEFNIHVAGDSLAKVFKEF